jgi:hypothetical protein
MSRLSQDAGRPQSKHEAIALLEAHERSASAAGTGWDDNFEHDADIRLNREAIFTLRPE